MPPMLHHRHVSPYNRCYFLMPLTFKKKNKSFTSFLSAIQFFTLPCCPSSFWPRSQQVYQQAKNKETRRNAFLISKCSDSVKLFCCFFYAILSKPLLSLSRCSLRGYFPHGQRSFQQPWLSRAISSQQRVCLDNPQLPWQPAPAVLHVNALPGVIIQPLTDLKEGCSVFIRKCNYQMIKPKHIFRVTWKENTAGGSGSLQSVFPCLSHCIY